MKRRITLAILVMSVSIFMCGCNKSNKTTAHNSIEQEQSSELSNEEKLEKVKSLKLNKDYDVTMGQFLEVLTNDDDTMISLISEGNKFTVNATEEDGTFNQFVFDTTDINNISLTTIYLNKEKLSDDDMTVFLITAVDRCNGGEGYDPEMAEEDTTDEENSTIEQQEHTDINEVCKVIQDTLNSSDTGLTYQVKYVNNSTVMIDAFMGATRQELEEIKDTMGKQNYKNMIKNYIGNDGSELLKSIQNQINDTCGFAPDVQFHLHAKNCLSLDVAFCTIKDGLVIFN